MATLAVLADEAADRIGRIADRAVALARGVALLASAAGGFAYLIGFLVLPGSWRWVWLFAGLLVALPPAVATWLAVARLRAAIRSVPAIAGELAAVVNDKAIRTALLTLADRDDQTDEAPLIKLGKDFVELRNAVAAHRDALADSANALKAVTSMPGLVALGTVGSFGLLIGCAIAVVVRVALL